MNREERLAERIKQLSGNTSDISGSPSSKPGKSATIKAAWDDPLRKINNIQPEKYFPPNRFSITPGPRWDGVDRSNGFEAQWFQDQNARQARKETAYHHDHVNL